MIYGPFHDVAEWSSMRSMGVGWSLGASGSWPSANLALFYPFRVDAAVKIEKAVVCNGANAGGNADVGIYAVDGTRLESTGSTARTGVNVVQGFTLATVLDIGEYYLALALDVSSGSVFRWQNLTASAGRVAFWRCTGLREMASAFPLPALATLAAPSNDYCPQWSLLGRTLV